MLANRSQLSKKKLITYLVIIGLMVGVNVFIYYRNSNENLSPGNGLVEEFFPDRPGAASPASGSLTKERMILENIIFSKLKKIGDWPVVPQNVGKADPFAPYFAQ